MEPKKVLITGASGLVGRLTLAQLSGKYAFSGLSRQPVAGIPHLVADIADAEAIRPAFAGIHTVLHLAAAVGPGQIDDWKATMAGTVQGTLNVYEAARSAGVKRVVFFSSGAVQINWELDAEYPFGKLMNGPDDEIPASWPVVGETWPVRPCNPYAVGKLFGEDLGRYYADKYGISTLVVRLGAVLPGDRPTSRRHVAGFCSQADCLQLIDKCLSAPADLKYEIFFGISENAWRWRDTARTKQVLGWRPTGDSALLPLP
jgi:nucleoside-diphosphate-sugar epimerase